MIFTLDLNVDGIFMEIFIFQIKANDGENWEKIAWTSSSVMLQKQQLCVATSLMVS